MKILIVEDHYTINNLLARFARSDNHQVTQTYTVEEALKALTEQNFDVIITDLMMPNLQGEDLIKQVRKLSDIYIIVISAKVELDEKIDVLKLGADDYLTKPFSVEEVMIKLKNISSRIIQNKPLIYSFNDNELLIYPLKRQVILKNAIIELTPYEYDILYFLIKNAKQILSRDQIINAVAYDSVATDRVIDAFIKNLRKKLNDPKYIKTHYGIGYEFVGEKDD